MTYKRIKKNDEPKNYAASADHPEVRSEVRLPEYVTPEILGRIEEMMKRGQIHPRHHLCDMTAEIAAGAPEKEALEQMIRRNCRNETYSIYQKLFPQQQED